MNVSQELTTESPALDRLGRPVRVVDRREEFSVMWASLFSEGQDSTTQQDRVKTVSCLMDS